jgi:hypothetical protein
VTENNRALLNFFTVISAVREIFAAKARNPRNAMQARFVRLCSEEHAVQCSENARKNTFLKHFLAQS